MRQTTQAARELLVHALKAGVARREQTLPAGLSDQTLAHVAGCAAAGRGIAIAPRTLAWLLDQPRWCPACLSSLHALGIDLSVEAEWDLERVRLGAGLLAEAPSRSTHRQLVRILATSPQSVAGPVVDYYDRFVAGLPDHLTQIRAAPAFRTALLRTCLNGLRQLQHPPGPAATRAPGQPGDTGSDFRSALRATFTDLDEQLSGHDFPILGDDVLVPAQELLLDELASVQAWMCSRDLEGSSDLHCFATDVSRRDPRVVRLPALAVLGRWWAQGQPTLAELCPWYTLDPDATGDEVALAYAIAPLPARSDDDTASSAGPDGTSVAPAALDAYVHAVRLATARPG